MIELTDDQARALSEPQANPPRVYNPRTREAFVLLPVDRYERLSEDAYDDSPWSREELEAAAWARVNRANPEDVTSPEVW